MRTIIDLPDEQLERLRAFCETEGISRAEAVRRGVALLLQCGADDAERKRVERRRALEAAFGSWKDYGVEGVEYQRKIRAEWDREWDPD